MPRRRLDDRQRARARRLGEYLARSRAKRGLSQEALARSVDISVDTLRSVEQHRTAEPSFFLVAALVQPLGLSLDDVAKAAERRR